MLGIVDGRPRAEKGRAGATSATSSLSMASTPSTPSITIDGPESLSATPRTSPRPRHLGRVPVRDTLDEIVPQLLTWGLLRSKDLPTMSLQTCHS
jgi:hypothetical protein